MFQSYKPVTPVVLFLWDIGGLILQKHTQHTSKKSAKDGMIGSYTAKSFSKECELQTFIPPSHTGIGSDLAAQHGPPLNTNQHAQAKFVKTAFCQDFLFCKQRPG